MEGLDAVDDELRSDRGAGVVGVEHEQLGLYSFVREDVERRLLDRMEGAVAPRVRAPNPVLNELADVSTG